ncbi:DNA-binding transcriptional regulator, MarR family [Lishizhenia tianjinensis]|uniref:DNA-binding transcriptional regulator, MarR family n=1 Tax=Lishizhenia tianjinensis TaxID=477690 RepID=A0A1I6YIF4_9FLAO|nr:MarR family transcriptional regulator [Lishizhenia tianjinensis]SFT50263.1 DNA-binding transcriptional regulator, MarR family [Lishizhenia tianjinensis]
MKIEELVNSRFKNSTHKAVINIKYTANWLAAQYNCKLSDFGLSLPQFNVMRILRGAGEEINVKLVKERMIEKSPNTTRLFDKLVEKEYIARRRCEHDRRVVFLQITQAGLDVLAEIDVILSKINHEKNLTDQEAETLSILLDKLRGCDVQ